MPHDDLQRLSLRLGVVNAMAAKAKDTAGHLAKGSDEYERAILKRTNTLAKQIRREGVGTNPKLEEEYCRLLMQRRRMLQTYELAKKDGERMPDVGKPGVKKALRAVPFHAAPTIYLICATDTETIARELAVSLSSAGIEALACADTPEAVATATMLREVLGSPLAVPQSGFRSWDRGLLQGQAGEALSPFIVDNRDEAIPGGESFNTYHARFMTSLTPLLILVGRGIRHTLGVVTLRENLILAQSWLNSGGNLGDLYDLDLAEFSHRIIEPGSVLRLSFTPEGWEGEFIRPLREESPVVLAKGRGGRKPMPGQLGMDFDEEAHPREGAGQHDGKYKGGEFVPKANPAAEWAKNINIPVEDYQYEEGSNTTAHYAPEKQSISIDPRQAEILKRHKRYGVNALEAVLIHERMHHLWHVAFGDVTDGGNPEWRAAIEALEKVPHSGVVDEYPKGSLIERAVETLAVHTINPDLLSDAEREWAVGVKEQAYANRNAEKLTLYRRGAAVGRSGAGTFYTFDPNRLEGKARKYEKTFRAIHEVPAAMHDPFAGNPSEALRRQWLPHLNPHDVWLKHGKALGHKSAVDTGDWLVAHAAHERGHDGIRYEGLEMQSLLDGFAPNPLFAKLDGEEVFDRTKDWQENGVRSQAFKSWFGDWENNPAMASKVVDEDGKPQETTPIPVYHGTVHDFTVFDEEKLGKATGHPTTALGFFFSASRDIARTFAGERLRWEPEKDIRALAREKYGQDYHTMVDEEKRADIRKLEKEQPKVVKEDPFKETPEGSRVLTAYLNLRNPHTITTAEWDERFAKPWMDKDRREGLRDEVKAFKADLIAKGHDGIILEAAPHMKDRPLNEYAVRSYVAFKSEQIKSTENEGTFDPTSPDIRKSLGPFVPPDMPKWQHRPKGDDQRYLPLNAVEDREKLRGMVATMEDGTWEWDKPIICSGDQLLTGSHRYHAAKETGKTIPTKDFGEVCAEGGIDFEQEWRARAEPFGGWISNLSNVIRLLPPGLAAKYGIELG